MRLKEPRKEGGRKRLPSLGFSCSSSFSFSFPPFSSASLGSLSFRLNEPRSDGALNRLLFCAAPSSLPAAGSGSAASAAGAGAGALKLIVPLSDHAPSPAGRGAQSGQPQRA